MMLQVFTVFDSAVGAYLQPFFCRSRGEALRSFSDACNDDKQNFYRHAGDYTLVHLGEFDDAAGAFISGAPVRVISALECKLVDPFQEQDREASADGSGNGRARRVTL